MVTGRYPTKSIGFYFNKLLLCCDAICLAIIVLFATDVLLRHRQRPPESREREQTPAHDAIHQRAELYTNKQVLSHLSCHSIHLHHDLAK